MIFSCIKQDASIRFLFINNSSVHVEFLFPAQHSGNVPYKWGTMYDLAPEDTTSSSAWHVGFSYIHLLPGSHGSFDSGYNSIEQMSPYDTVRFFVFDGSYHYLPSDKINQDTIFESENYLCRYDLTKNDLYHLAESSGDIVISYPPSEKMKNVKMFPSYERVTTSLCSKKETNLSHTDQSESMQ